MINSHVNRAGYFLVKHIEGAEELSRRPETLSHFEIWWVQKGSGCMRINAEEYPIEDNSIYCLPHGIVRALDPGDRLSGCYLAVSGDGFTRNDTFSGHSVWVDALIVREKPVILTGVAEIQEEMEIVFRNLQREFSRQNQARAEIISGLLYLLAVYLSSQMNTFGHEFICSKELILAQKFKTLVRNQFVSKKLVVDYARDLRVTQNQLNQTLKRVTGYTAKHLIRQQIIGHAKMLSIQSDFNLKETAYALGFNDPSHFSKFFSNNCGMSYSSFRKRIAN